MMETEHLQKLIQTISESKLTYFEYEEAGSRILLKKEALVSNDTTLSAPVQMNSSNPDILEHSIPAEEQEGFFITSPLVGVFYAAPGEKMDPFVQIGQSVKKGETVAIIEAMKLMNEIECESSGIVKEILVENGQSVEYGQPLFRILPQERGC